MDEAGILKVTPGFAVGDSSDWNEDSLTIDLWLKNISTFSLRYQSVNDYTSAGGSVTHISIM